MNIYKVIVLVIALAVASCSKQREIDRVQDQMTGTYDIYCSYVMYYADSNGFNPHFIEYNDVWVIMPGENNNMLVNNHEYCLISEDDPYNYIEDDGFSYFKPSIKFIPPDNLLHQYREDGIQGVVVDCQAKKRK